MLHDNADRTKILAQRFTGSAIDQRRCAEHTQPHRLSLAPPFKKLLHCDAMCPIIFSSTDAGWSSLAARRAHNPKVVGSNPTPATKAACCVETNLKACQIGRPFLFWWQCFCHHVSICERLIHLRGVRPHRFARNPAARRQPTSPSCSSRKSSKKAHDPHIINPECQANQVA
jgi:hypothetical protein